MHSLALTQVQTCTRAHVQESRQRDGTGAMIPPKVSSLPGVSSYLHSFLFFFFMFLSYFPAFALSSSSIWASQVAQMVKNRPAMQETRVRTLDQEDLREDVLEKEMAAHCSIRARRIPWRKEAGRSQSRGSQRVRHV